MILKCDSCDARLKIHKESLGSRTSAKCPRCGDRVSLLQAGAPESDESRILVKCSSCGARLKAPASRAGTSSRCPRCHETVAIAAEPQDRIAPGYNTELEESSGAATRRIDSRSLGVGVAAMAQASQSGGMDLDDFVKQDPPRQEDTSRAGIAESLVRPETGPIRAAAEGIRRAAEDISPVSPGAGSIPLKKETASPAGHGPSTGAMAEEEHRTHDKAPAIRASHRVAPFPSGRGFLAGGISGAIVGGVWAGFSDQVAAMGMDWLLAPIALASVPPGMPEAALRVVILALLGAVTGFVAAALGSPKVTDRPLSLARCGGLGLLAGLTFGLLNSLAGGSGFDNLAVWPTVDWMRDVLLAGLFTPALNRILPGSRT